MPAPGTNMLIRWILTTAFAILPASTIPSLAMDADRLVGEWTVSATFESGPKLASLRFQEHDDGLQATIFCDRDPGRSVDVRFDGENLRLTYSASDDDSSVQVTLDLQPSNQSLVGTISAGQDAMRRTWACRAARPGTPLEQELQRELADEVAARVNHVPNLPAAQAAGLLGSWQLSLRSALQEGAPEFVVGMEVIDVRRGIVVGITGSGGVQRPVYRVESLSDGIAFEDPTHFLGLIRSRTEVRRSGDNVSVRVVSIDDGTLLWTGVGKRTQQGEDASIGNQGLSWVPRTELKGWIRNAQAYAVQGNTVFVQQDSTLSRISIHDPLLTPIAFCRIPPRTRMISGTESIAYGINLDAGGIQAFDVMGPTAKQLRYCPIPGNPVHHTFTTESLILGENWNGIAGSQQIHLIDISQPGNPERITSFSTPSGITNYELEMVGHQIHLATGGGLLLLDAKDPYSLREISCFKARGTWVRGIASSDSHVYLVTSIHDEASWMQVVDVSDPARPREVATWTLESSAKDVVVSGSVAYVADATCLHILDVADPAKPTRRGFFRPRHLIMGLSLVKDWVVCKSQVDGIDEQGNRQDYTELLFLRPADGG